MNIRDCAGCIHFKKHYGTKNKLGERTASNYWCIKKQGFIRSFPKKCQLKEESAKNMMREKPCKFAVDNGGEVWECGAYRKTDCAEQRFDMNPDGSVNIVMCGYEPPKEE